MEILLSFWMHDTQYLQTQPSIWVIGILLQITNINENYDVTKEILNLINYQNN